MTLQGFSLTTQCRDRFFLPHRLQTGIITLVFPLCVAPFILAISLPHSHKMLRGGLFLLRLSC